LTKIGGYANLVCQGNDLTGMELKSDRLRVTLLYDFYGELLTERQRNLIERYYNDDFSLREIGEELGISRQAVYESLKRAEKALEVFENKLGLVERFQKRRRANFPKFLKGEKSV